jgi:hypothetical protein
MRLSESVRVVAAHLNEGDEIPLATLPAAIPYFLVRVTAICVEKRELDVVREFILRALALGFSTVDNISGFLGVHIEEVRNELMFLAEEFFVAIGKDDQIRLLEKGIAAISEIGLRRVTEREAACCFNGVSRKIEQVAGDLVPKRRLPAGTLALPAVPARAPRGAELDLNGVKSAMLVSRHALPRSLEITRLGRVGRSAALFLFGHLLLRRGTHSVPSVCVSGAADTDLARILGAHPALQHVRTTIERTEKQFRRYAQQFDPKLRRTRSTDPSVVRSALTRLVALEGTNATMQIDVQRDFVRAAELLLQRSHWIADSEWHVIFVHAILSAKKRLLVVSPLAPDFLDRESVELLGGVAARGVEVEVWLPTTTVKLIERDDNLTAALVGVKVVVQSSPSDLCGLSCDDSYAVLASVKACNSSMGIANAFVGAFVLAAGNAELALRDFLSQASKVLITTKKSKLPASNEEDDSNEV